MAGVITPSAIEGKDPAAAVVFGEGSGSGKGCGGKKGTRRLEEIAAIHSFFLKAFQRIKAS